MAAGLYCISVVCVRLVLYEMCMSMCTHAYMHMYTYTYIYIYSYTIWSLSVIYW